MDFALAIQASASTPAETVFQSPATSAASPAQDSQATTVNLADRMLS